MDSNCQLQVVTVAILVVCVMLWSIFVLHAYNVVILFHCSECDHGLGPALIKKAFDLLDQLDPENAEVTPPYCV